MFLEKFLTSFSKLLIDQTWIVCLVATVPLLLIAVNFFFKQKQYFIESPLAKYFCAVLIFFPFFVISLVLYTEFLSESIKDILDYISVPVFWLVVVAFVVLFFYALYEFFTTSNIVTKAVAIDVVTMGLIYLFFVGILAYCIMVFALSQVSWPSRV